MKTRDIILAALILIGLYVSYQMFSESGRTESIRQMEANPQSPLNQTP